MGAASHVLLSRYRTSTLGGPLQMYCSDARCQGCTRSDPRMGFPSSPWYCSACTAQTLVRALVFVPLRVYCPDTGIFSAVIALVPISMCAAPLGTDVYIPGPLPLYRLYCIANDHVVEHYKLFPFCCGSFAYLSLQIKALAFTWSCWDRCTRSAQALQCAFILRPAPPA